MSNEQLRYKNGKLKFCLDCSIPLTEGNIKKYKNKKGEIKYKSKCLPCNREYVANWMQMQRWRKHPRSFWQCDNCLKIQSVINKNCFKCNEVR